MLVTAMTGSLRFPKFSNRDADQSVSEEITEPPEGDENSHNPGPCAECRCHENTMVKNYNGEFCNGHDCWFQEPDSVKELLEVDELIWA